MNRHIAVACWLGLIACAATVAYAETAALLRPVSRPASLQVPETEVVVSRQAVEDTLTAVLTGAAIPAFATTEVAAATAPRVQRDPHVGSETNLPLPRFVSLKTDEGNVRRGPSLSHRIDWVFVREDMPLQITAEYGHWRRVIDRDGLGGWVHYSLLSGSRTVIVDQDLLPLYARADPASQEVALIEAGVIARIDECGIDWCRLSAGGYRGWAPKTALWGIGPDEVLD
jgi:SH3-like domain-containing protein